MSNETLVTIDKFDDSKPSADELRAFKRYLSINRALNRLYGKSPLDTKDAIIFDGELKSVMVRKPSHNQRCIIDWVNIVIKAHHFYPAKGLSRLDVFGQGSDFSHFTDYEKQTYAVQRVAKQLLKIIGFDLDLENSTGRNFYQRSFNLRHGTGFIAIGGQNDTIMISINGTGCTYANLNWELMLYDWLDSFGDDAKLTRIDLAYDALDNHFLSVDLFNDIHSKGGFTNGGRLPNVEFGGNWKNPSGRGRTLYIGSRQSSKYCRIYEKGKQLGNEDSPWLRIEVEYKSRDIYIPLDILLDPTDYFLASYPCFYLIDEDCDYSNRFISRAKDELITFEKAIEILKQQYGRYLYFFRCCYQDDTQLLDILTDIPNKQPPSRLDILTIPKELQSQCQDEFGFEFNDKSSLNHE